MTNNSVFHACSLVNQLKCEIFTSIWLNESLKFENSSYNVSSIASIYVFSMLAKARSHSDIGRYDLLYLATPSFVFA